MATTKRATTRRVRGPNLPRLTNIPKPRSSRYRSEYAELVLKLGLLNLTEDEIRSYLDITEGTWDGWKRDHKEFKEALKKSKLPADAQVAATLFKLATGYKQKQSRVVMVAGAPEVFEYDEIVPPNLGAICFFLKNRQREKWRDRPADLDGGMNQVTDNAMKELAAAIRQTPTEDPVDLPPEAEVADAAL